MLFSVIIPTYNPKSFLPKLLSSIVRNKCLDDIEIIISDDCSDEPFDDILDSFKLLNIKTIQNETHTGFPRTGRQNGANNATGEWLCFADQDDFFTDNAFDKIKKFIEDGNIKSYIATNFIMHPEGTEEYFIQDSSKGWTHGKFYEKTFWDEHNLGYDDVEYCEDVNLSTKIGCIMTAENIPANIFNDPIYVWERRNDSLADSSYFLKSMKDYIKGTFGVITDYIDRYKYNADVLEKLSIKFFQTLYHTYFYFQCDTLNRDKKNLLETILVFMPFYERFKNATGFTTDDVIKKTFTELNSLFAQTRYEDFLQVPFSEQMTFSDWVKAYIG